MGKICPAFGLVIRYRTPKKTKPIMPTSSSGLPTAVRFFDRGLKPVGKSKHPLGVILGPVPRI
jgi:hypothetical protein